MNKIIPLADVTGRTFWTVLEEGRRDVSNNVVYCLLEERNPSNGRRPVRMDCWVPGELLSPGGKGRLTAG